MIYEVLPVKKGAVARSKNENDARIEWLLRSRGMCARFRQTSWSHDWKSFYGIDEIGDHFVDGYNVAPTDTAAVVRTDGERERVLVPMRWGLIPSWAKDRKVGFTNFNARAESVATKPGFRSAFERRRCIVIMDGWYEWKTLADGKQPYLVEQDEPLAAAGLWEVWRDPKTGERLHGFTIITTDAAPSVRELHERMPALLPLKQHAQWLDPATPKEVAHQMLLPVDGLRFRPVSRRMNNSKNKSAEDAKPLDGEVG